MRSRVHAIAATVLCTFVAACASLHTRSYVPGTELPQMIGPHGAIAESAATELIDKTLGARSADDETLVNAVRQNAGAPLTTGNHVDVLVDGPRTFAAIEKAITEAKHSVHVEVYIFADDAFGQKFAQLLMDKRAQGVEVRVLYDGIGSMQTSGAFFDEMRKAGVEVLAFRPPNPVQTPLLWKINNRDHRKITVVDSTIGFTGGVNVSGTYAKSSGSSPGKEKGLKVGWRDTHVQIEGPAVAQLQTLFLESWNLAGGKIEDDQRAQYFPEPAERGSDLVTTVANDGDDTENRAVYACEMASIEHASKSILLTQAYFAPNADLVEALVKARKRGVDVRIVVPGFTDSALIFYASRATYSALLKGGVRIYEDTKSLLHAKTAVIDGVVSTVGSSNFDMRSFIHNNEASAIVVSRPVGRTLEQLFEHDLTQTREITLHDWQQRSLLERFKEKFSSAWAYWL